MAYIFDPFEFSLRQSFTKMERDDEELYTKGRGQNRGTEELREACAVRFKSWIKTNVPTHSRKRIAKALGASPETVDSWLDANNPRMPGTGHLLAALASFGPEFAAFVLAPCGEWTRSLSLAGWATRLRRELDEMRRHLDAMDSKLDTAAEIRALLTKSEAALQRATISNEGRQR